MTDNDHLLQLLRETLAQCQRVRDVWRENEFRLIVAGLDITDAECAAFETRISHLKNLIAAIEKDGRVRACCDYASVRLTPDRVEL